MWKIGVSRFRSEFESARWSPWLDSLPPKPRQALQITNMKEGILASMNLRVHGFLYGGSGINIYSYLDFQLFKTTFKFVSRIAYGYFNIKPVT